MSDRKILRNSAKCAHCDVELVSTHHHDFKTHVCSVPGKIRQSYNHDLRRYVPAYPQFWVDGGRSYIRRMFTSTADFVDTSIFGEEE
jgi:hypothetical protein